MKIRKGFVSNSSSSSFVVHHSEFASEEQLENILKDLSAFENKSGDWGESARTFEYENGYLIVETNYVHDNINDIFRRNGIDLYTLNKVWIEG